MNNNPIQIPLLARGSHAPGSGYGCIMNLMSYEQGRSTLDGYMWDRPVGFASEIQQLLIRINDNLCGNLAYEDGNAVLCSACSSQLIDMAHACYGKYSMELAHLLGHLYNSIQFDRNCTSPFRKQLVQQVLEAANRISSYRSPLVPALLRTTEQAYALMSPAA